MKTLISRERIFKSSILFFTVTAFILSAFLLTSCSASSASDTMAVDDAALIAKIESAAKITVDANTLPAATANAFNGDLSDSFVDKVQFASGLGYKVSVNTDNESRAEKMSDVYFSTQGKQLADHRDKIKKRRHQCFEFVFPVDFIMPDNTSITLTQKADWVLIRGWYKTNTGVKVRPTLVFPVNVTLEDGTIQTLIDRAELDVIKDSCRKGKDKRKCFKLVLPVSFTMSDATVIKVTQRADFKLLREWHKANPTVKVKGSLNFPVNIEYKDGTTTTVASQAEFDAAKGACKI